MVPEAVDKIKHGQPPVGSIQLLHPQRAQLKRQGCSGQQPEQMQQDRFACLCLWLTGYTARILLPANTAGLEAGVAAPANTIEKHSSFKTCFYAFAGHGNDLLTNFSNPLL